MLLVVGCSFRDTPVSIRERLAFDEAAVQRALDELNSRYGCESVILSTCNRVELYMAQPAAETPLEAGALAEFLGSFHGMAANDLRPHLYEHRQERAVRHLFTVVASLDSLIVGEAQIAGQVKRAYALARRRDAVGPLLHALFQHARVVAGRVRSETGIAAGHVSVSSVAVDYVRQVFERFDDKTVLVIGAGKMGELTLRHLRNLQPREILVANRNGDKAAEVAKGCGGKVIAWEDLDRALIDADIVLSTTGSTTPIMTKERFERIRAQRTGGPIVILDIAVPRDFEPEIHDGDRTWLFNIDDLKRIREQTLKERQKHIAPAEAIVDAEAKRFLLNWSRRRNGPIIARLSDDLEAKRQAIVKQLLNRLDGTLTEEQKADVEGAFRLLQNQFLHGPITALTEEAHEGGGHALLEALRKLFRL